MSLGAPSASKNTFSINETKTSLDMIQSSGNGLYRGKELAVINNLNDYIAFRNDHRVGTTWKDVFLGDYIQINDGTYNMKWRIVNVNYYYNKSQNIPVAADDNVSLQLMPFGKEILSTKMYESGTISGGYKDSLANTVACPAVANAMQRVFGSYLRNINARVSKTVSASMPSMAGAGQYGASTTAEWITTQCILPSEAQIYGFRVCSSSYIDVGEADHQFSMFQFVNTTRNSRTAYWLRDVANSTNFCFVSHQGVALHYPSDTSIGICPVICIG